MAQLDSVVVASSLKSNVAIVAKVMNREKLQRIFGPKCRYAVRAYERVMIKEA